MPSLCVFGAQWGDEGKGKIIDRLARDVDMVVRYQGGANAGHTVVVGDRSYVLHLIPSGILHPQKINVIGAGAAVDPLTLLEELDALVARGVAVDERNLRVSASAHVIFEHHRVLDRLAERWKGEGRIGTTGRGIGPCYADKAARIGLRICDMLEPDLFRRRLKATLAEKNAVLEAVHGDPPLELESQIERYLAVGERLRPFVADTGAEIRAAYAAGKHVLFEGAQGVMLDIDSGTYPYVTSSNAGVAGIPAGAGVPPQSIDRAIGIAKAYCTRVGEGPFPTELGSSAAQALREAGNEYGATTGRPRRCGWFDAVAARFALEITGAEGWVMTNLDVLSGFGDIQIGVAYRRGGERWTSFPSHLATLDGVEVEYLTFDGWEEDISGLRAETGLPDACRAYLQGVEAVVGVPIRMLSVGPEREQVIGRGL